MPIHVECNHCGREVRAPEKYAGRKVKCPDCSEPMRIPEVSPEAPPKVPPRAAAPALPPRVDGVTQKPKRTFVPPPSAPKDELTGHHSYWLLLLALIPLAVSMFWSDDVKSRVIETFEENPEAIAAAQGADDEKALFAALPGGRVNGALLSRTSSMHLLFAAISFVGYLGLLLFFARGTTTAATLVVVAIFTGIIGISILLGFQWVAFATQGMVVWGRSIVVIFFYLAKFIGFSYVCAISTEYTFWPSFFGFTFGVGLCEELCKALPIAWYLRSDQNATWRTAALVGLASGVGFGVSEGITYSGEMYNGVMGGGIYAVRFVSCVALHAIWAGTVGLLMYRNQDFIQGELELEDYFQFVIMYLGIPMILHGLYDVLLKFEMNMAALAVAVVSFGLLAWTIEATQREFGEAHSLA